jgi:UDP-2,3-diacylglucosamine pyrophosphatase LpxH
MIICVSDWHIDNGKNRFSWHYKYAQDFLDFIEDAPLFMIGDTLELWACEWYEVFGGPYDSIIKRLAEREDTVVFQGNHDIQRLVLSRFFPKAEIASTRVVGDRVIFHGFQVDSLLDSASERCLVAGLDKAFTLIDVPWLNALRDKIADSDRSNEPLIMNIEKNKVESRYLIGHSHVEEDRGWFANTGSLMRDKFPYIKLEDSGDVQLMYF